MNIELLKIGQRLIATRRSTNHGALSTSGGKVLSTSRSHGSLGPCSWPYSGSYEWT